MMALDLFTDANLPAGWLLGAAIPLLALLIHKNDKKAKEPEPPETG